LGKYALSHARLDHEESSAESRSVESDALGLVRYLSGYQHLIVAFSGGVDSSVVLAAAKRANLSKLIAVTAYSASVAGWQLNAAKEIAEKLAVEHWVAETDEVSRREYQKNDSQRCFFCKQTLYATIDQEIRSRLAVTDREDDQAVDQNDCFSIASGTNHDDLGDHRPGIRAGMERGVLTPLATLGLGKKRVRAIAEFWGLPNHDLPASPCLASRIAYGVEVTPERLGRVEQAEAWLFERGFREFRVRVHEGELARIEVSREQQGQLCDLEIEGVLTKTFQELGFRFVTMDLQGFRSGSLNRTLVSIGATAPRQIGLESKSKVEPNS
jgi:uncharacterized protein